jgi:hypothetical protein
MWIRKNADEIAQTERIKRLKRFDPTVALLLALGFCFLLFVCTYGSAGAFSFDSRIFPVFFLFIFTSFYLSRAFFGKPWVITPPMRNLPNVPILDRICVRCQKIQPDVEAHRCACGGELEPLDHWRWIEDSKGEISGDVTE